MRVTYIKNKDILSESDVELMALDCLDFMSIEDLDNIVFHNTDKDTEVSFVFNTEYKTNKLIELFKKYNVFIASTDITDLILLDDLKTHDLFNSIFNDKNIDTNALPLLNNFIKNNTTSDIILDKILKHGINNITELDKYILENNIA